jgi:hypothetical protein
VDSSNFLPMGTVVVFLALGLACTVLWVWSLVEAVQISDDRWVAAGQSKVLWIVLIAVLGLLGSLLYAVMARPAVRRTA